MYPKFNSRIPYCTLLLAVMVVLIAASPLATQALQFDRETMVAGEPWRLFTGHLTHFGWNHLAWNVAVFLGLGSYCETLGRRRFLIILGLSMAVVSAVVLFFQPQFKVYRGLSGVDSALYGTVCAHLLAIGRRHRDQALGTTAAIALFGFGAKTIYELSSGATVFADAAAQSFEAVPLAHLIGLLTGIALAWLPSGAPNNAFAGPNLAIRF